MEITGSKDVKIFLIDADKVMIEGKMYYEKPADLPKAGSGYALLADVLQFVKMIAPSDCGCIKKSDLIARFRKHFS